MRRSRALPSSSADDREQLLGDLRCTAASFFDPPVSTESSCSRTSASDALLTPCISALRAVRELRPGVEALEEPVDDAALHLVVVQRLADDALRELGRQPAEVGPQRRDDLLALRRELLLAARPDPIGLLLGLGPELVDDRPALGPRLLADAARVSLGLLQQLAVLGLGSLEAFLRLDCCP